MPTFDNLNLSLARNIGDPVATASTNGSQISSARRVDILNQAIREFIALQVKVKDADCLYAAVINTAPLSSYIKERDASLSSSALALSGFTGGLAYILSARNDLDNAAIKPLPLRFRQFAQAENVTTYYTPGTNNQYYILEDGNFTVLGSSSATANVNISYLTQHTDLAAGGTILIPSEYHHEILDLATARALEEKPTSENLSRAIVTRQRVYQRYANNS